MYSIEYKQKIANQLTKYYVSGEFWKLILNNPEKPWICQWISNNNFKNQHHIHQQQILKKFTLTKQFEEELIQHVIHPKRTARYIRQYNYNIGTDELFNL